ncbi:hypothetical protein [Halorubrum salipaludis]|uniref:hypothetical protein n=1 Tax=Halorubrum salipaludis TaxID=2032630 RepID=UPI0018EA0F75|nr:hypothetical protein [Halorubrum salipaludis]
MVPTLVAPLLTDVVTAIDRPPQWTGLELVGSALIEFVLTAIFIAFIGAVVSATAPDFTADGVGYLRAEPAEAFVYGLVAYVATAVAMFLLAITIIGLVVVVPAAIVLAILGLGGTAVSVIALGTWVGAALGDGTASDRGTALVVGAIAWAGLGIVPVLGGLATFVVSTMGFGYLVLWLANGQFDRDYGSVGDDGNDGPDRPTRGSNGPDRESTSGESFDDPDRFRNIAAVDAEREAAENERTEAGSAADSDDSIDSDETTDRDR